MPATGILGTEHRSRERRAFRLLAPHPPVYPTNGSMPQNTPLALSLPGPVARNGLSLTCNGCRFHGLHSRVNGPDLLLRSPVRRFPRPFGLNLHPRYRFAPASVASPTLARCAIDDPRSQLRLPLPLPFRIFTSFRIKAFANSAASWPAFRPARSPFAPRRLFYY